MACKFGERCDPLACSKYSKCIMAYVDTEIKNSKKRKVVKNERNDNENSGGTADKV